MYQKCLFAYFFTLFSTCVNAQIENKKLVQSPNASSLGIYGEIPVDLFTGTPNISIPLYNYRSRDISVPISIDYHPSGIKPSDHASWVGLGWNLQAGGVITRILNDLPDEVVDRPFGTEIQRGFFYNYNNLASSNWTSLNSMQNAMVAYEYQVFSPASSFARSRIDFAPDEFEFNFLGMSGSLIMGQDGQWHLKSKQGLNFKVSIQIGPYAVWEPNINTQLGSKNFPSLIRHCLTQFILTSQDGTKYYFGTDPATDMHNNTSSYIFKYFSSSDSNSVEFSRIGSGFGGEANFRDGGTIPVSWYLTKIQSSAGDVISFKYTRDGPQILMSTSTFGTYSICPNCYPVENFNYGGGDNVSLVDGITLSSISGANGSIVFNKSIANILDYTFLGYPATPQNISWGDGVGNGMFWAYTPEVFQTYASPAGPGVKSVFMKLNNITINDSDNLILKKFQFNYNESPTNRLFLNSVSEVGSDGTVLPPYTFDYNNISGLDNVPYNTIQVDHWGFYNAFNPLTGLFTPSPTGHGFPYYNSYYSSNYTYSTALNSTFNSMYTYNRRPIDGPLEYAILQQITYPTGGNNQFIWEPNNYSKYLLGITGGSTLNFSIQDLGANTIGAGVRIKQILSNGNFNSPTKTKTYTYYRDYAQNNYLSSGVLNSDQPRYTTEYYYNSNYLYRGWSNRNANTAHYTNGSPITYSNVQELNSDGSYTTYIYSNQDNGYIDQGASNYLFVNFPQLEPVLQTLNSNSLQLERGLLLNEQLYKIGSIPVVKKFYYYNNDPARLTNNIRKYSYDNKFALNGAVLSFSADGFLNISSGPPTYWGDILSAENIYFHYPYLQSQTTIEYDENGTNPLTKTQTYTYDNYRNIKTGSSISSKGDNLSATFNYAADNISGLSTSAQEAKTNMVNLGMLGIPLEKFNYKNTSIPLLHTRTDYQSYTNTNTMLVPANTFFSTNGNPLNTGEQYVNYDSKGNILEYITKEGIPTSFDWGYNQAHPVVKIDNAANTLRTYFIPTPSTNSNTFLWNPGVFIGQNATFTVTTPGTITLSAGFSEYPGSAYYNFYYTLSGPVNQSGSLCIAAPGVTSCGSTPSNISFNNMPTGTYTISIVPNSNYSIGTSLTYTYPVINNVPANSGYKEYFYEGFEDNINSAVVSGNAHTGNRYWGTNYSVSFSIPNAKTYLIQWWSLQTNKWIFNQQIYTNGMVLGGPVDDIRIFPSDALMSTYTYKPLVGMTSEILPNGDTKFYEYDAFNRLNIIRDQDKNVIKKICYNYAGQTVNCLICNSSNSAPNWQNTSAPPTCQQNSCGNTGYQLQEQRDMNPCSSTYNQTQIITIYNPTACPPPNNVVTLTYQNGVNIAGFTALYTSTSTNQTYSFAIPTGSGTLGCIPPGTYFITVSKPVNDIFLEFSCGCKVVTGTSAAFGKTYVSSTTCNSITINFPY